MFIEIEVPSNTENTLVISGLIGEEYGEASIGIKKFISVGKFEYQWILEFLSVDELESLVEAALFVANHMRPEGETE